MLRVLQSQFWVFSGCCWLAWGSTALAQLPANPNWGRAPSRTAQAVRPVQYEVESHTPQRDPRSIMRAGGPMEEQSRQAPAAAGQSARPIQAQRPTPASGQAAPGGMSPVEDRFVQVSFKLRNVAPAELEYFFMRMGARNEVDETQPSERFTNFRYKNGAGVSIGMRVDRVSGMVELEGIDSSVRVWRNLVATIDTPAVAGETTQIVPVLKSWPERVKEAIALAKVAPAARGIAARNVAFQGAPEAQPNPVEPNEAQPGAAEPMAPAEGEDNFGALLGNVQLYYDPALDQLVIKGRKEDVDRVLKLIEEIEKGLTQTQPEVEVLPLKHVNNQALSTLILQVYDQVFSTRQGRVTIIPLVKPNALLLIGRQENLEAVKDLITKLDQPTDPNAELKVYALKNIPAAQAELTVRNFFVSRPGFGTDERLGLGTRVQIISDFRNNSLIVQAAPRDLAEVARIVKAIDGDGNAAKNEVRVFRLKNALSQDLAPVLQQAITGSGGGGVGGAGQAVNPNAGTQAGGGANQGRSTSLQFLQIDGQQSRLIESGILSDMSVVADTRGNALVVTGPARGMELMEALISQLDNLPTAEAQIKVFTVTNGDATALATLLAQLFGQTTQAGGGGGGFGGGGFGGGGFGGAGQLPVQTATGSGETSLVPLRFSVDARTNSIVASGTPGDLRVVYQILLRLDEGDVRERVTTVYRLLNAPALDVSTAINQWLQGRRQINQLETQITSPFEQIEREVIVVPEVVSNSLIVSATPRYFDEVRKIVTDLDRRPPMVVIQVCIAEVTLGNVDEFGVELGLQDSLLFDRGIGTVGFPFVGQPLGNNADATSLATRNNVAGQATGSFGLGRSNATLGYGGLVLSASNESVSVLVRALQDSRRLNVISRPQVQTLDNQPAFVQVGARVPRISSTQIVNNSQINATVLENVGILLGVTPRTSPDGLIVMEINAEKSQLGPIDQGIPISINANGDVIRSPQINITTAQTTVSARSGQTVILGGLITTSESEVTRRVPYLADVPVVGRLFRFDSITKQRTELLIIMTPFIMRTDEDVEWMNQRESERMSWCLADIVNVHGEVSMSAGAGAKYPGDSPLIFPDTQGYSAPQELLPSGAQPSNGLPRTDPDFLPGGNPSQPERFLQPPPYTPTPAQPLPGAVPPPPQPGQMVVPLDPLGPLPPDAPLPMGTPNPQQGNYQPGLNQPGLNAPGQTGVNGTTIIPVSPPEVSSRNPNERIIAPAGYFQPLELPQGFQVPAGPQRSNVYPGSPPQGAPIQQTPSQAAAVQGPQPASYFQPTAPAGYTTAR